jgi:hypothetical protein
VINARFAMVIPVETRILGEIFGQGDGNGCGCFDLLRLIGTKTGLKNMHSAPELMKQATRDDDYRRWMKEFLGG